TGDEEATGRPLEIARRDLIDAAKRTDVALSFEGGSREYASITRRGASGWLLKVKARQAHSAGVFGGAGYGAIYQAARILTAFRGLPCAAQLGTLSRAPGYPALQALDASRRGAGDLSFVAPYIPGVDGLGALGGGAHSPDEFVHLPSLEMQTARAALLMARLAGLRK